MRHTIKKTVIILSATIMTAQAAPACRLQATQLTGKLQVSTPGRTWDKTAKPLPLIGSGSIIRVLSGAASFESDCGVDIWAKKGNAFYFTSIAPADGQPEALRLAVIGGNAKIPLEVKIGVRRFLLGKDSFLNIELSRPGELTIRAVSGYVQVSNPPTGRNGGLLVVTRALEPRKDIKAAASPERKFRNVPVDLSALKISRVSATAFEAKAAASGRNGSSDTIVPRTPGAFREVAELTVEKYGPPSLINGKTLVWSDNGPWKRTVVSRNGPLHNFPRSHRDIILQVIGYDVPLNKISALESLDAGLLADRDAKELSSVSDSEEMNFLALNLADAIILEKISPEAARDFFLKTAELADAGKSNRYMEGLLFRPTNSPR